MTSDKIKVIDTRDDDHVPVANSVSDSGTGQIDVSDYHRAVESLRARDELESARLEAAEFRVRLDGAQATVKRVSAERDRARSDLERRSLEIEDLRAEAAGATALAAERKQLVAAANERALRAEAALADLQEQLLSSAAPAQASGGGHRVQIDAPTNDAAMGSPRVSGSLLSRMFEELRRLS